MTSVAAAVGAGRLLGATSPSVPSSRSAPASSALYGSSRTKARNSYYCIPNSFQSAMKLSLQRTKQPRRFSVTRAKYEEGDKNSGSDGEGPKESVDWDKAWSKFSKPKKKSSFLKLDMEQYVSRSPKHSDYPLSEEVDPLRKTERLALGTWTSMKFTFGLIFVIVGLVVYMVVIVGPPPPHVPPHA